MMDEKGIGLGFFFLQDGKDSGKSEKLKCEERVMEEIRKSRLSQNPLKLLPVKLQHRATELLTGKS